MPCHYPLQGYLKFESDGKKSFQCCPASYYAFVNGTTTSLDVEHALAVPCGRCMACRLERSRQVALRAVHESKLYFDSCFVTLTFSDEMIARCCPKINGRYSLVRKHLQDFMKRLREKFSRGFSVTNDYGCRKFYMFDRIRVLGCGEYGDDAGRPHYHLCLFNCSFPDRKFWKMKNGFKYYNSKLLDSLWSLDRDNIGHAVIGDFSFETAAYVARYCTKKVTGDKADDHYRGILPEFPVYSLKPGLGADWFERHMLTDFIPHDCAVIRGVPCKLPRYYDKLWERFDPQGFAFAKEKRLLDSLEDADDNTYQRLRVKEKCMDARIRLLVRDLEKYGT